MKTKLISFIVPIFNEIEVMPKLVERFSAVATQLQNKYRVEIILVDDGSTDGSWDQIMITGKDNKIFKGVKLSGNFGHQAALMCGYKYAKGDAVITIDADMQDPPEVSLELIKSWELGGEVVFAVRKSRAGEPFWRLAMIKLFYWLRKKIIKTFVPSNSGDFRLLDQKVVKALNRLNEQHPYVRGIIGKLGFKRNIVLYDRQERQAGVGKYPLYKLLKLASDGVFSMSLAPLKLAFVFSLIASLGFVTYLVFNLIYCDVQDKFIPWFNLTLIFMIYSFALMLLICLGILGEYIGRIYDETKARPIYFVDQENNIINNK